MDTQTRSFLKYIILPLFLFACAVFIAWYQSRPDFLLHISAYEDNGIFIQTFAQRQVIVGSSATDALLKDISRDMSFFDRSIDLLILTQADSSAVSLAEVLQRYEVDLILMPKLGSNAGSYLEFLKFAAKKHIPVKYLEPNQKIQLDESTVLRIVDVENFAAELDFGSVHINLLQDLPVGGKYFSEGVSLYKN